MIFWRFFPLDFNQQTVPSGTLTKCNENNHKNVSFPINGMVDLSIVLCKRLPGDPEGKSVSNEPQTEHHPIASSMKHLDEAAKGAKNLSP